MRYWQVGPWQGQSFLFWSSAMYCPTSSIHDPELHQIMVPAGKAAPSPHIPNQSFFVRAHLSSLASLPALSKVMISALEEPPGLCVLGCAVFPAVRKVKFCKRSRSLGAWGCFQKSLGSLIDFLFLIRRPLLNTHNSITMLGWTLILIHKL